MIGLLALSYPARYINGVGITDRSNLNYSVTSEHIIYSHTKMVKLGIKD